MTKKPIPPRKKKGIGTHYSYTGGGHINSMRIVEQVFNLSQIGVQRRRELIHELWAKQKQVLARLPVQFEVNCDLDALERFLEGEL